jgi:hypothetical protein
VFWFAYLRAVAELHERDRSVGSASDEDAGGRVKVHAGHGGRVLVVRERVQTERNMSEFR